MDLSPRAASDAAVVTASLEDSSVCGSVYDRYAADNHRFTARGLGVPTPMTSPPTSS